MNDISSSDNDAVEEDDSDIVLDDIVMNKVIKRSSLPSHCILRRKIYNPDRQVPECSRSSPYPSMVAHCLPLPPSTYGDVRTIIRGGIPIFSCLF